MGNRLPALKGREVVKALKRAGFEERHVSGSHVILKNPITKKMVVVPLHGGRDIKRGTLFSIIHQSGLSIEDFEGLI